MENTMTKAERIDMMKGMIKKIEKDIRTCDIEINTPMLVNCNCIVATKDAKYSIGTDEEGFATVLIGDLAEPCWMSEKAAKSLLYDQKFEASNGYGPLHFEIMGWKKFYRQRKANLLETKEAFDHCLQMIFTQ